MGAQAKTLEKIYYIIDFDSTFMQVEALEELVEISLECHPQKEETLEKVQEITSLGVDGKIPFSESLSRRLALLNAHKTHLNQLIERLKKKVSKSILRNKEFFYQFQDSIYIISSGFKEFIEPVVADFYIKPERVFANSFHFDELGNITGFDTTNPLAFDQGKPKVLAKLNLDGEIYVIGDAYTDYEMKSAGIAHKFFAFTENVLRENILDKADYVIPSFDEFLYINKLPMSISYPKNRIKALLLENIHADAERTFDLEGYQVETIGRALSEDELIEKLDGVSILGIRSKTQITEKVIAHANRLKVIGAFCIGTNQVNLEAAGKKGIITFNAPYSNTRSVVELTLAHIIMLMRRIPEMDRGMHEGKWNKSAVNSNEVRGKKLGIVGYGNIGSQLSVLAEAVGMDVYYYDVIERLALGNVTRLHSMEELLRTVDVVTLHVDGRDTNHAMFGEAEFDKMKTGSIFINLSRGFVVDIQALSKVIENGKLRGAAVDVFPEEPKKNTEPFSSPLSKYSNVILTPHIGGSTQEAQQNIAAYVPSRIIDYINTGNSFGSVNFPNLQLPHQGNAHRLIHIHQNVPGILAKINSVLAKHQINIEGQYLKTNENLGYVITDIDTEYNEQVLEDLKEITYTISFRVLY